MLLAKPYSQFATFPQCDSVKISKDSLQSTPDDEAPSIEVNVKYNLVVLDKIALYNSEDTFPVEAERASYPVGAYISLQQKGMGIGSMYIKIDKAMERLYTKPLRLSQRGYRTLIIRALDELGNEIIIGSLPINVVPQ